MKSLIGAVLVGMVLFGASAGVSWYLTQSTEPPADEDALVAETDPTSAFPKPIGDEDKADSMPVAMRPDTPITVEAVTKLANSIMKKEEKLFDKQTYLQKEENRIGLLFEDLRREREELMAFGEKIDAKILLARETLELLKQENQTLTDQTNVLSKLEKKTGKKSTDAVDDKMARRVDAVKDWFKNTSPEQGAKYIEEFANRGEIEFAARLLDSLEARQTSKILDALDDAALGTQLIDAFTKGEVEINSKTDSNADNNTSRLPTGNTRWK